jgi:protein-disulfide isomerase
VILFRRAILFFVLSLATGGVPAEEKWVADEIFLQMSEMRKSIQALESQVNDLTRQVNELKAQKRGVSLKGTEAMTIGRQNAGIAIIEFSDFECPFCAKHYEKVLPKLRKTYVDSGVVKYLMKDFPLAFHGQAKKAAVAARCAGEQGKYWAMHDKIFEARGRLGDETYLSGAEKLKLKMDKFRACLNDPAQAKRIEEDIALGEMLGVQGTPAFFVGRVKNGELTDYQRLEGVQSFETFAGVIDGLVKIKQ